MSEDVRTSGGREGNEAKRNATQRNETKRKQDTPRRSEPAIERAAAEQHAGRKSEWIMTVSQQRTFPYPSSLTRESTVHGDYIYTHIVATEGLVEQGQ
jgi:hypothetical protein